MLIECERHKAEDLELWREIEEADMVRGEKLMASGKHTKALEIIQRFCVAPASCFTSWGKDSVVLAHLCSIAAPSTPLVHMIYGPGLPYLTDVRDVYLSGVHHDNYQEFTAPEGPRVRGQKRQRFDVAYHALGTKRYLSGIRQDEKGIRVLSLRKEGLTTANTCRPIGWWTTQEVFGYLAVNHLPVHPNYAMLGAGRWNRDWLRVASLGGKRGTGMGRREWEREYYGDVLNRIQASVKL